MKQNQIPKKKTSLKSSKSKKVINRQSLEQGASVFGEERMNRHRSYLKISKKEDNGRYRILAKNGEDLFYLGTYDLDLINSIVDQICNISLIGSKSEEIKIRQTNAALASILEIAPQDSVELMLASQMTATHNLAMEMSKRALLDGQTEDGVNFNVNRVTKLMRTFTSQAEALNKYRNKGKQQITVKHQNVNVNDGGQAVIGDINQGGGNE